MGRYLIGRLGSTVLMFFAVTLFVFVAFYRTPQGPRARSTPSEYRLHGLTVGDYAHYVWRLVRHGDLGSSFQTHEAVSATLFLFVAFAGLVVAFAATLNARASR